MMLKYITNILFASVSIGVILADYTFDNVTSIFEKSALSHRGRSNRAGLLSFQAIPDDVHLGLDIELPFVRVPLKRKVDKFGNEPALVNINTAAILTSGLIAGGGMLLTFLFRTMGLQGREGGLDDASEAEEPKERYNDKEIERRFLDIFDPFKLVYKNTSGERVETTLSNLVTTIEKTLPGNDINLSACMQKSICTLVYKSNENMRNGRATGIQKIIDGLSNLTWLMRSMQPYAALLREAVDTGKLASRTYCDMKYPQCMWSAPEEKLLEMINAYVKFT